ncbi:MAG: pyruvate dehydrogenase (acetyl-transferring) E1 component subunit alpha [Desulfuromonadales bacterium]|nr:MAG: pyruvate dehydrogenase (acetyl-transferring) E1 component subunit alpha [Desulfuromonadales bacterium]
MPEEVLATFTVRRLSILNESGDADEGLMPPLSDAEIRRMHELMVLARTFDERALTLQREGRLGTYPPILGQEAAQVGSALALHPADWVFPSFREMGVHLTLGYPIHLLFQYWAGDGRGLRTPENLTIFPICVSVGTHIPHAVGAAMAARYRRDPVAVCCFFGDGATSKGDFHEGFNLAGVFRLPVVFICQNNQWAISVPLQRQTAAATLAQKAVAYGFEGVQVDGNDVFAVHRAAREALDKARSGGGPTFIECLTYRMADHTTADDAARYRPQEEVETWRGRDPILRLERFMTQRGLWSEEYARETKEAATKAVDEGVRTMEASPPPAPEELFDHTGATLTPRQAAQRKEP